MESFFLSETTKYLYLLHANTTDLPSFYIFTTEGHLLPPFRAAAQAPRLATGPTAAAHAFIASTAQFCHSVMHRLIQCFRFVFTCCPLVDLGQHQTQGICSSSLSCGSSHPQPHAQEQANTNVATDRSELQQCSSICEESPLAETQQKIASLRVTLPLIALHPEDGFMLRYLLYCQTRS